MKVIFVLFDSHNRRSLERYRGTAARTSMPVWRSAGSRSMRSREQSN